MSACSGSYYGCVWQIVHETNQIKLELPSANESDWSLLPVSLVSVVGHRHSLLDVRWLIFVCGVSVSKVTALGYWLHAFTYHEYAWFLDKKLHCWCFPNGKRLFTFVSFLTFHFLIFSLQSLQDIETRFDWLLTCAGLENPSKKWGGKIPLCSFEAAIRFSVQCQLTNPRAAI